MKTFEDLVAGRTTCFRVYEDELHLAFLAPSPVTRGHTIVVTKRAWPYLFDLPAQEHAALWAAVREVARHLQARLGCPRVCVGVIGWEVRHAHVHLVPTTAPGEYPPLAGRAAGAEELEALRRELAFPG